MKKTYRLLIGVILALLTACQAAPIELAPAKSSGIEISCDNYSVNGSSLRNDPDVPNYIGSFDSPILMNLETSIEEYYESPLSEEIYNLVNQQYAFFTEAYEQTKKEQDDAIAAGDEKKAEEYDAILSRFQFSSEIQTVSDAEGYFAFASNITWSEEDGVERHKVQAFNLDVTEKRFLTLADLFKDDQYQSVLEKKMKEIVKKTSSYKELLYEDSQSPTLPDVQQFFLSSENLVIFYNPGEVAAEEEGVVYFEIPLVGIQKHLAEKFAIQTIAVTRPSSLFAFSTRKG